VLSGIVEDLAAVEGQGMCKAAKSGAWIVFLGLIRYGLYAHWEMEVSSAIFSRMDHLEGFGDGSVAQGYVELPLKLCQ